MAARSVPRAPPRAPLFHRYAESLAARAAAVAVSFDYRVAPEHPCARGLRRRVGGAPVGGFPSHRPVPLGGQPRHMFLAGESAGANIVHNLKVGWGTDRLPSETPAAWRATALKLRRPEMRDGAWGGGATLVESDGEDHCFHLSSKFNNPNAVALLDHVVAEFIAMKGWIQPEGGEVSCPHYWREDYKSLHENPIKIFYM
ncbi:hypothetical protein OsJ_29488 [Oryza sativa Japonica Group]|uniref:Alpha/beta hydrolase fold-3 domain-containing protein n=1 Tax=Oryza sativa subsp. japonica TaxID=39947 RepID=B9G3S4_ORYSJ|nr:hypothetical protein OsJ_29488 [Oryza sativa Japonica Group]